MRVFFASLVLLFSNALYASSFDNFANTGTHTSELRNIIVKTKSGIGVQGLGFQRAMMSQKPIIQDMNISLLEVHARMDVQSVLEKLRQHPDVIYAQLDHEVTLRAENQILAPQEIYGPNDPRFLDQWSMHLTDYNYGIDALSAWTTFGGGGKDRDNNEIVVAVIDGGMDVEHPDLVENIWVNPNEIPANQIDDDNNGYIDDINGWNAFTNTGAPQINGHGTHVAGTIGARGDNGIGVAGVNWDVKIMNIPGASGNTSVVLRAYNYVLEQKKLWLETGGARGANIVATNSSFGVAFADCASGDYPAWNDIYNEMGKVGILSAAATMNNPTNIDERGDVPTGCSSPYIVAVTNSKPNGERAVAAYGKNSIHLAAPGTRILSTFSRGRYAVSSGTSMSTPHVAGAVAFMNRVASEGLMNLYRQDPGLAALEVKRLMMETVTPSESLAEETVSGGVLNLMRASQAAAHYGLWE